MTIAPLGGTCVDAVMLESLNIKMFIMASLSAILDGEDVGFKGV